MQRVHAAQRTDLDNHRNKTSTKHYSNLAEVCTGTMCGVPQRCEGWLL